MSTHKHEHILRTSIGIKTNQTPY